MVKKKHSYYSDPRRVSRGLMPGEYSAKDLDLRGLLEDLEKRITSLEATITTAQKESEAVAAEMDIKGSVSEASRFHVSPMGVLFGLRRAFYGYAMLLDSMGLSKDQKAAVQQLQNMMNMVIRLQQTLQMADIAIKAFYAQSGPVGWMMLALSAGTLAGSMVYGSRGIGG